MSDSGLGFSVKRFVIFIVACAIITLVFEGMSDVGGSMIKGQVSRTTSKFHPEKNVGDRINPFLLETIPMMVIMQLAREVATISVGEKASPFPSLSVGASVMYVSPDCV